MNTYTYHLCLLNLGVCKPLGEKTRFFMFAADQAGAKLLEEAVKSSNGSLGRQDFFGMEIKNYQTSRFNQASFGDIVGIS